MAEAKIKVIIQYTFSREEALIAQAKYAIDGDILQEYRELIQECWYNGYTARRTVEKVADKLFG